MVSANLRSSGADAVLNKKTIAETDKDYSFFCNSYQYTHYTPAVLYNIAIVPAFAFMLTAC